jgi:23S rRNA (guanosine2251-2'-O)-methyltransferase
VLGNEARGLSQGFREQCDLLVGIPMPGALVDSLNLGVAAGILLYERANRR